MHAINNVYFFFIFILNFIVIIFFIFILNFIPLKDNTIGGLSAKRHFLQVNPWVTLNFYILYIM